MSYIYGNFHTWFFEIKWQVDYKEIQEQAQHEAFKKTIKAFIMNNNNLSSFQKQQAVNRIDAAAQEADLLVEMLRMCGFIQQKRIVNSGG